MSGRRIYRAGQGDSHKAGQGDSHKAGQGDSYRAEAWDQGRAQATGQDLMWVCRRLWIGQSCPACPGRLGRGDWRQGQLCPDVGRLSCSQTLCLELSQGSDAVVASTAQELASLACNCSAACKQSLLTTVHVSARKLQ